MREYFLNQLWEACAYRDSCEMWKVSRLIAGCPLGPKTRKQLTVARKAETQIMGNAPPWDLWEDAPQL